MPRSETLFAAIEPSGASDTPAAGADGALPRSLSRMDLNPDTVQHDLARLVLGLVEIVRQLMERQAFRRVESGKLSEEQIESIGLTLMRLEERMEELKRHFGVREDELCLDLGHIREEF